MLAPTIAIIAPGAMGAAVGARLVRAGCSVLTSLAGRSPASAARARAAGMVDATLPDISRRADWVFSILPPSSALAFAESFKAALVRDEDRKGKLAFVDCNAISPETAKRVAKVFTGTGVRFVDAGIVGGPPTDTYNPAFYASAEAEDMDLLDAFVGLEKYGLRVEPLRGEGTGVGDASALKMSYAGITKGFLGIATTMILAAHASSPATAEALLHQLGESQPAFLARIAGGIPGMLPKAYRWVGEMEEISTFVRDGVGEGSSQIYDGFAQTYAKVEEALPDGKEIKVLKGFAEGGKAILNNSGGLK
ncbi:6-phosphogluconate dehydrogenase C-terminal domain-like protein [Epithele typhae]|uniref:6-phosphogluconate dehydrogenase C-terminal domain-like protein n=1 Tax=Epithele typhae TaxID=378194 RepID=UPI002008E6A8|nr:6-phosphogluconate dehydrogenase C-terminal domain-like protein [Epithele typhae]KAH9940538.1 6-phosphogluconate dehydrogenase C-terminal domain-like protein [Epithele typhae]